jgi:hypothetical protein
MGELEDVLAVNRGVESAIGTDENLSRYGVGRHFDFPDDRDMLLGGNVFDYHLTELLRRLENALRLLAKERRKSLLGGHQTAEEI